MALPASGIIKASDINLEAARATSANAPLGVQTGTAGAGSLVKLYDDATPSPVDQNSPYAYSDFYGKSYTPPVIACGTLLNQGGGQGYFEGELDFSTTTGAIVVYFYVSGVPDGVSFLYNSVTYNTLTSNAEGRITAASGTNNIVGSGSSSTEAALIAGSPYTLTKSVWNGTSFGVTGNTESGLIAAATNINLGAAGLSYTLVIPKSAASPSTGVLKILGNPLGSTVWIVSAPCPITLPSFTTNSVAVSSTVACCTATQNQTYYFARNATLSGNSFVIDTNTLPQVNNFVFSNSTGATALANGYYKINSTQALYVQNGVVDSIVTCPTCLTPYSSSTDSVFNGVCPLDGSNPPANQTYYHNGSGTLPAVGDRCFSDAAGTSVLGSGYYYLTGTGSGNRTYIQLDNNGDVLFGYPQQC
tara:strand:+ start:258 stop:1508 length:1251 start_codon:yes stop_codon:yes gene_type:complete